MVQDLNATFRLVRLVVFGVASVFAFIVLALGASITDYSNSRLGGYFSFAALGIAVGILTLFSLPVLLWVSTTRKSAITSMIAVEVAWTWFLWVMWLALAGSAASVSWLGNCGWFSGRTASVCHQTQAVTAFGFITWLALLGYNFFLLFLVIRQHTRGNAGVWKDYILEADYTAQGSGNTYPKGVEAGGVAPPVAQYPPVTQQVQPQPQTYPQQPYVPAAQPN